MLCDALISLASLFALFHYFVTPQSRHQLPEVTGKSDKKYAKVRLDKSSRSRIQNKLKDTEALSDLLCSNTISLPKLASNIGEKPHYVTQVLHQELNTTFYDFVTEYRIDQVKQKLQSSSNQTILELAFEVGFDSKSAFNTAFKKITGITPSAYRKKRIS